MKKIDIIHLVLFCSLVIIQIPLNAQRIGISKSGLTPDNSAILDVTADSLGVLIPRVSLNSIADDTTIVNPANSLLVYNINTTGSMIPGYYYWDSNNWIRISNLWKENGSNIFYDGQNVGIGTSTPDYQFEVVKDGSVANIVATTFRNGYSAGSFTGRAARGSFSSPEALLSGNYIASFNARGYTGSKFTHIPPNGRIAFVTEEDWSDTAQGTYMKINTTPSGDTISREQLRITGDGKVGIGTTEPAYQLEVAKEGQVANIVTSTYRDDGYTAGSFTGRAARGTISSPAALLSGDYLASFNARGYTGSKFTSIPPTGRIGFVAEEDWSDTAQGTYMKIHTTGLGDTISSERIRITADGKVGIGVHDLDNLLTVIGNSEAAFQPIAYFENTCDTVDGQLVDAFGIMGVCDQTDWAGYGVYGKGGFVGVRGRVNPIDSGSYYGIHGQASGGSGENFGVEGFASGNGFNKGLSGRATGGHTNYGIYGRADTSGLVGTYAGFFEGDLITTGRVGIGLDNPAYPLQLVANSGAAHTPAAYFENTCDTIEGNLVDAYGVLGICENTDYAGYGGVFRGGYVGSLGQVSPSDTFTYFGVRGIVNGGAGNNYGLHGFAGGDGTNIGVRGRADGPNANYGVWGFARAGTSNYGVFGGADTTGVEGTYAGYFSGDVHTEGSLGIGIQNAMYKLDVNGDINFTGMLRQNGAPISFTGDFSNGGDAMGLDRTLGNNDNYGLGLKTNGSTRVQIANNGSVGIGTNNPQARLQVDGGIQIADDNDTASADKVGTLRYRSDSNNSYVEICMQTGASTYDWVIIKQNNW